MVIVGNKYDIRREQRQVSEEQGRQLAESFDCGWTEASARWNENISKAFELLIAEIEKARNPIVNTANNKCLLM